MKSIISCMLLLLSFTVSAQDKIKLKTGGEISGKVSEISADEIKFKKADNPEGPVYIISKSEIATIQFENGTTEIISLPPVNAPVGTTGSSVNATDKVQFQNEYYENRQRYKKSLVRGIVMMSVGGMLSLMSVPVVATGAVIISEYRAYTLHDQNKYHGELTAGRAVVGVGGALLGTGITLLVLGRINLRKATQYKQKANQAKASMSFSPVLIPSYYGTYTGYNYNAGMKAVIDF